MDRVVRVLEQGRIVTRGLACRGIEPLLYLQDRETLAISIDWSEWLGADTITAVDNAAECVTVVAESFTPTSASLTLRSRYGGCVEHRITTTSGETKVLRINVDVSYGRRRRRDYDYRWIG
ncbi:MAG: hypothetical protein AAGJ50_03780 [Pseudomonadota bacterium]